MIKNLSISNSETLPEEGLISGFLPAEQTVSTGRKSFFLPSEHYQSVRRNFILPFLVLLVLFCLEMGVRALYFGFDGIVHPGRYLPVIIQRSALVVQDSDPEIQFRLKPNSKTYLLGKSFATNPHGMRDHTPALSPSPGVTRIALLGASISMGYGVADQEIYSKQLQMILDTVHPGRYEVLNFSVAGYSYPHVVASYDKFVKQFKPDIIMVPLYYGDLDHAPPMQSMGFLWHPTLKEKLNLRIQARKYSFLYWTLQKVSKQWFQRYGANWPGRIARLEQPEKKVVPTRIYLEKFVNSRHREEIPVIFYSVKLPRDKPAFRVKNQALRISEWAEKLPGAYWMDLYPELDRKISSRNVIFPFESHPNAKTHRLYAQAIAIKLLPYLSAYDLKQRIKN